ncbi:hypothetical protein LZ32DRAFT_258206 [Colletotrichum eremochloae]|nr:hypothetical protein LZ32DRAFT_258206 [Colletotrichum eremochloae]
MWYASLLILVIVTSNMLICPASTSFMTLQSASMPSAYSQSQPCYQLRQVGRKHRFVCNHGHVLVKRFLHVLIVFHPKVHVPEGLLSGRQLAQWTT